MQQPSVLFLCTGNYYRSRFAEIAFNALAAGRGLGWRAASRGLALERGVHNVGPISRHALDALLELGIPAADEHRMPLTATEADFQAARHIVAVKHSEHRPLLVERHPAWVERVEYWQIDDVQDAPPTVALERLHREVVGLVERLAMIEIGQLTAEGMNGGHP